MTPGRAVIALGLLAGCTSIPVTPLEDRYKLDVHTTLSAYAAGDSVYERITNRDRAVFYWHRCPGVLLQRNGSNGWDEVGGGGTCTAANFGIEPGETLTISFQLPSDAPPGSYRAQVRMSAIFPDPPLFWWAGNTFSVSAR